MPFFSINSLLSILFISIYYYQSEIPKYSKHARGKNQASFEKCIIIIIIARKK